MPLGGYCEICKRWVWVTGYGECENGHPASAVRDVQQLVPQRPEPLSMGLRHEPVVVWRAVRHRWWWRHSLWVIWTFTFGLLNWVAFFYIGVRARRLAWILAGALYLLPTMLTVASIGTWWLRVALPTQLLVAGVSTLHALIARPMYRAVMFGDRPGRALASPPQPPALAAGGERLALPRGLDAEAAEVIQAAHRRVRTIVAATASIHKPQVRERIAAVCGTAEQILDELGREPRQIQLARAFFAYYLEAAQRIVTGYADLAPRAGASAEVDEALVRAERSLDAIEQAFEQQLRGLLERRVIDLESEVALLEKTVQLDARAPAAADAALSVSDSEAR